MPWPIRGNFRRTIVVGANFESSNAIGVNGDQSRQRPVQRRSGLRLRPERDKLGHR